VHWVLGQKEFWRVDPLREAMICRLQNRSNYSSSCHMYRGISRIPLIGLGTESLVPRVVEALGLQNQLILLRSLLRLPGRGRSQDSSKSTLEFCISGPRICFQVLEKMFFGGKRWVLGNGGFEWG
jgi:hypothetical protein